MQVRLLGPLSVVDGDRTLALGGPKERSILAVLALEVGNVVSEARLIEAVWGDDPPRTAGKTLQNYVFRLRKAIAQASQTLGGVIGIETRSPGYLLVCGADGVDVMCVERLVNSARQFARAGDHESAAELLARAAGYWHGRPLEEFADQPFAAGAVARLEELRMAVLEERIESALALGRHDESVPELEELVAGQPLRERFWALLMIALYRSNRQADSLRAFTRARAILIEELGVEPGPALRQLEQAVLVQDRSLDLRAPPASSRTVSPGNLPLQVTSFVGRDAEVGAVADALERARVVTLTGPGGVGKTRLALEVAGAALAQYPDGAWLCQLAPLGDGEAACQAVATALSVPPLAGRSVVDSLVESLRARRLLLVLDNAEHLIESVGALVEAIVRSAPHVAVLVTSRAPLAIDGELVLPVTPLVAPGTDDASELLSYSAVVLFADRARLACHGFSVTDANARAVKEICQRLDGMPLALELAAARVRSMSPAEIATRLERPFALLDGARRTGMGRQRTLRETVDWSYGLLGPTEQLLFNRLAVFAGGFSLDAAESVCSDESVEQGGVSAVLAELVDKSMVVAQPADTGTRYRLLETLREYGQERLQETGEAATLRRRHAEYFVRFAEAAELALRGPDEARWVDLVDEAFYDLRAAEAWAVGCDDADKALRLVAALHNFALWSMRYEVAVWGATALELDGAARHPLLPTVLGCAAYGAWASGAFDQAVILGERGLAAEQALGTGPTWLPRNVLAHMAMFELRLEDALAHVNENVMLARSKGERYYLVYGLWVKAGVLSGLGDHSGAAEVAEEALTVARQIGSPSAIAMSLHEIGRELRDKDPQRALDLLEESARTARTVKNRLGLCMAERELTALQARDDPFQALRAYPDQIDHWHGAGDWWNQWITIRRLAVLLLQLGRAESAAVLQAAATAAQPSRPPTTAHTERLLMLEDELGAERFASAIREGATMRPDEVLAYAKREVRTLLAMKQGSEAVSARRQGDSR